MAKVSVLCSLSNYLGTISYGTQRQQILDLRVHVEFNENKGDKAWSWRGVSVPVVGGSTQDWTEGGSTCTEIELT